MSTLVRAGSFLNRRRSGKTKQANASKVVRRRVMYLIIDGYNLMHVTRFKPKNDRPGELQRCREGLLALLADRLHTRQYREITVVFDSDQAPKHLPDRLRWRHLQVLFARHENTADDLIAKLVRSHSQPKLLVVVSSDHRVQNVARGRKSTVLDSEDWFDAILDYEPAEADVAESDVADDEPPTLSAQQLEDFVAEMKRPEPPVPRNKIRNQPPGELENPFPPGYFDDLEDE